MTILTVAYTAVFNILDVTAISFPTGVKVDKEVDVLSEDYQAWTEKCRLLNEGYDKDLLHGMPISLQLVGRRLEEEKVLGMTDSVLKALQS